MIAAALLLAAAGACPPPAPSGMIARAAAFGGVIAPSAEQAEEAVVAGMLARDAARHFLGVEGHTFLIAPRSSEAASTPHGCAFLFAWDFVPPGGRRAPTHVLPHEIGHSMFIRFLAPGTGAQEYGGGAPDWLDEMAAMAFEDASGVRTRRSEARRHALRGALIPLSRLLSMPHPEWAARRAQDTAPGGSPMSQPASADTPAFYATVRALFDFLIHRTGDERVVRLLADQLRAGRPLERWLLDHIRADGLPGLDAEIQAFVLSDRAYRDLPETGAPQG
jgi:hypothetical protein